MTATSPASRPGRGFTLVETLIVVGIIGIFTLISYPSVLNILEERNLENTARQVQTYLLQTKLRAVSTKVSQRVRFFQVDTQWTYEMEEEQPDGVTWVAVPGAPRRTIPARFTVTISLPASGADHVAVFSPIGIVPNFTVGQNEIVIRSPKLDRPGQMDERVIGVFMGGSINYAKRASL